jgi:O-antigen/teichoic acid export membrane protein
MKITSKLSKKIGHFTKTPIQKASLSSLIQFVTTLILIPLGLILNPIAINNIGIEQFGLYSLVFGVVSNLCILEGGLGHAITQATYEPLVNEKWGKVRSLNLTMQKYYRLMGLAVIILGICAGPLLPIIVTDPDHLEVGYIIYAIAIIELSCGFIFFLGKRPILEADQRQYIGMSYNLIIQVLTLVIKIIVAVIFRSIIAYGLVDVTFRSINMLLLKRKAEKLYGFIDSYERTELKKEVVSKIIKNSAGALLLLVIGLTSNLDNMMISMYVGLAAVGIYANYFLILQMLQNIVPSIVGAMGAGIGQAGVKWSNKEAYTNFLSLNFASFVPVLFSSAAYFVCIQHFIPIWIGEQYLIPNFIVFLMSFSLIVNSIFSSVSGTFISSYGLVWKSKFANISGAIARILSLLILVTFFHLGIAGILVASIISVIFQYPILTIRLLKREVFKTSLKRYYLNSFYYIFQTCFLFAMTYLITNEISLGNELLQFLVNGCIAFVCFCLVLFGFNFKTAEFRNLWEILRRQFKFLPMLY